MNVYIANIVKNVTGVQYYPQNVILYSKFTKAAFLTKLLEPVLKHLLRTRRAWKWYTLCYVMIVCYPTKPTVVGVLCESSVKSP